MATDEELFKIILQVQGAEDAKRLATETAEAEQRLRDLLATQKAMGPAGAQMASMIRAEADALHGLQDQLRAANQAQAALGGATRNTGQAILEGSRALEDLQYGIGGVLNNIPSLIQAMGGPAGLAGVVSLVAVGATQLYKHWDELAGLFGQGHTKTEAERMKDLAEQTEKTAAETKKLADYERQRDSAKSVIAGRSKDDTARASAVEAAFKEAGGDKVLGIIREFAGNQLANTAPEEMLASRRRAQDEVDRLTNKKEANGGSLGRVDQFRLDSATKERDSADSALAKRVDKWIEDYLGKIPNDPKALEAFTNRVDAAGKNPELVRDLREAQKTSADKEEEAYTEWRAKQEEEYQDRLAKSQIASDEAALAEEKKYEAWRIDQEKSFQDRLAREQASADDRTVKLKEKAAEDQADESAKAFDAELKAARKSRSFIGKSTGEMTPAELLAKQEHDKQAAGIAMATRNQSFLGKEDEDLTPEEKIAKKRADAAAKARERVQGEMQGATGVEDYVKSALLSGGGAGDISAMLKQMGFDPKSRSELLSQGFASASGDRLKEFTDARSQTLQGGASLRDAIQGGVSNKGTPEEQLAQLRTANANLELIARQIRDDRGAIAS